MHTCPRFLVAWDWFLLKRLTSISVVSLCLLFLSAISFSGSRAHLSSNNHFASVKINQSMARTKQKLPLQRAPSSDIMQAPPDLPEKKQNGKAVANGSANGSAGHAKETESEPGLVQLAICVGGIYASLYVSLLFHKYVGYSDRLVFSGEFSKKPSPPQHIPCAQPLRSTPNRPRSASPFL